MYTTRSLLVSGDDEDGAARAVLGHQAGSVTGSRHQQDRARVLLERGADGSHRDCLGSLGFHTDPQGMLEHELCDDSLNANRDAGL